MDKLNQYSTNNNDNIIQYRALIKQLLSEHATLANSIPPPTTERKTHLIFDEERDHYMLFRSGWWQDERVRNATLYVRLHNGKIWIEEDMTEECLATDLLRAGVRNNEIVLAFHHPTMRPFSEFAVA